MPTIAAKDANGTTQTIQTLPAVGQGLAAASLPVVIATDQSAVPVSLSTLPAGTNALGSVTMVDGGAVSLGAKADTAATTDAGTFSLIALIKRLLGKIPVVGSAASAASLPVVIASDQAAVPVSLASVPAHAVTNAGAFAVQPTPTASANGATASRIKAAASTNATNLKASAGNLLALDVFNVAAYDVFLKFYNKASAPTVGTDTPVWTIPIKAGTGYSARFPVGKSFATGIAYAITKLQADSDTTVVAADDVTGSTDWI